MATPLALTAALLFAPPTRAASPPCAATTVAAGHAPAATVGRAVRCVVNAQRAARISGFPVQRETPGATFVRAAGNR